MIEIKELPEFTQWLRAIKDTPVRLRLLARLRKAQLGNLGDVRPVGSGVQEMREHFGAGWRMYLVQRGAVLMVMLGGGDNASQQRRHCQSHCPGPKPGRLKKGREI